jgi:hypothetical protein
LQNHGSSEATIYNIGELERGPVMDITVPARGTSGAQYLTTGASRGIHF